MKILFTADLHIKLGQKNVPIDWAKSRYKELIHSLKKLQKEHDICIIGGDIFDRAPTIEELEVFFTLINNCVIETIIYSGNHEAVKRNTTFLTNLKNVVHSLNDKVTIIDDFCTIKDIDFIPYNKLKEYYPQDIGFYSDILCTHVRGEIPPHVKSEVPLELFERWKVVLAGDLHSYDNCQRNILYPGSPLTTSFHRNEVDTGVISLDTDTLQHKWIKLNLPQLLRKTIKVGEEMPATEFHHTIYEIEGDMAELGGIEDSDLVDKKIIKRDTDTSLILSNEMSLEEEVREYLQYIVQVQNDTIEEVLMELTNNANKFPR